MEPIKVSMVREYFDTRKCERSRHHGTLEAVRNKKIMYTHKKNHKTCHIEESEKENKIYSRAALERIIYFQALQGSPFPPP